MFMEIAHVVAKRSTCMRLNVGAVVVQDRRIVSIGYNGAPSGAPHCAGNECPGKHHCHETIHAEDNALRRLNGHDYRRNGPIDVYVTDSPCAACFGKIKRHGYVRRVFFANPYRITDHLVSERIGIYRVTPAGYIVDWNTKELVDVET
jgi:dCMP deaminase